jgi:eukaryotic-like serine/threonine-protein kinase
LQPPLPPTTAQQHGALRAGADVAGYRVVRLLGQGSQSQVFLAEHRATGQPAALKLAMLPAGRAATAAGEVFLRSVRQVQALPPHPGIVSIHAAGVQGQLAWLAMEALPGGDLARYTRAPRLLPEAVVLQVAQQVAVALAHAHRHGLVHRDLKPSNVLVDWASGSTKLVDFGLARADGAEASATGLMQGTPAYMSPEQLAGSLPTPLSDFYALGVTTFELLVGRRPHEADTLGELLRRVASQAAPSLLVLRPDLPVALAQLVDQLLARTPQERLGTQRASAADLAAELGRLQVQMQAAAGQQKTAAGAALGRQGPA